MMREKTKTEIAGKPYARNKEKRGFRFADWMSLSSPVTMRADRIDAIHH